SSDVCSSDLASFYFSVFGGRSEPAAEGTSFSCLFLVLYLCVSFHPTSDQCLARCNPYVCAAHGLQRRHAKPSDALPGFWIFMNRVSQLTYCIAGISSTALHGRPIRSFRPRAEPGIYCVEISIIKSICPGHSNPLKYITCHSL